MDIDLNFSAIYQIKNLVNKTVYVGSAVNIRNRWKEHLRGLRHNKHFNHLLQKAWLKYGEGGFTFEILEKVEIKENLLPRESYWISRLLSAERNFGYNICLVAGSQIGLRHSDDVRKKMSSSHKGKKKTEAHQAAINKSLTGRKLSLEHREKISKNQTGRIISEETRDKMRAAKADMKSTYSEDGYIRMTTANLGKKNTPEHCKKISIARTGMKLTEEHKKNLSIARKKMFLQRRIAQETAVAELGQGL